MACCANHKGPWRGMSGRPTTAVLGYLLTVTSLFILLYFILLVSLAWPLPPPPPPPQCLNHQRPACHSDWPVSASCPFAFPAVNVLRRFVMEAQLRRRALGQSLEGPAWMDELSASQFCDERPRLYVGSLWAREGGWYWFLSAPTVSEAPRGWVRMWEEQVPREAAWEIWASSSLYQVHL